MPDLIPDTDNPNESVRRAFGWVLHDVFRLFQRSWNRRLRGTGTGLSPAQCRILSTLYKADGLTQTELADEVEMEKAPLGRLLDRLDELGFVTRQLDPTDRRVRRVYQTEKAMTLDEPMWGAARGMFDVALKGLTQDEVATLLALLERLKQNLLSEDEQLAARAGAAERKPQSSIA